MCWPVAAFAAPAVRTFERDPLEVTEVVLDNGLTVLLSENHERAEVFGAVVVRAGARHDPPDHTGIAHYLEHMLFKGTEALGTTNWEAERPLLARIERLYDALGRAPDEAARRAIWKQIDEVSQEAARYAIPNELDRVLAEIGGSDINAFTSPDMTVYHNRFPASQIEAWVELQAHRFQRPVFRLFASELEAVYEEKNRSMDGYEDAAYEAFMGAFFPDHPYGAQTILGSIEHLKRPSLSAMRRFYETHYVPGNMAVVLSGAFETAAIVPVIERTFGTWAAKAVPARSKGHVAPFSGRVEKTVRLTPLRAGAFGFRMPVREDADGPASWVLTRMLSNDQGSGLIDRLADDGKVLFAQAVHMDLHAHDGLVVVFVPRILTQSFVKAERTVREAIDRVRDGRIEEADVLALRENLVREMKVAWESNEERALTMVDAFARTGRWEDHLEWYRAVTRVGRDDVVRVAQRHLGPNMLVMRSRMGRPDKERLVKPELGTVEPASGARSELARSLDPSATHTSKPRWVRFDQDVSRLRLAPGVTLAVNENAFNDIYSLEIRLGVGREQMPELEVVSEYLERSGSAKHPASAMKEAFFALATTFEAHATDEAMVLRLQGPEVHLEAALELVAELLEAPAVDRKRRRRIRMEAWASERIERGTPSAVARALWEAGLYEESARQRKHGRRAQRRYGTQRILRAWSRARRHATEIRYVGALPPERVAAAVRSRLPLSPDRAPIEPVVRQRRTPERDTVYFVRRRDAVQTQVYVFVQGDPVAHDDLPRLHAFDGYLGGDMGGLVFQEVREIRALAYSAAGGHAEARVAGAPGYTWTFAACQADKTEETIEVLVGLLDELPRRPQRLQSVRTALTYALESADPGFRELQQRIERWGWQGHSADPRRAWLSAYGELQFSDIEAFWRDHVQGRPRAVFVVGDPRRIDRSVLERFGRVEVVSERRLYAPPRRRRVSSRGRIAR
jgi:zinc protease